MTNFMRGVFLGTISLSLVAATACKKDGCEADSSCDTGETGEDNTGDDPTTAYFAPTFFWGEGNFGYNPDVDQAVPYLVDDNGSETAVNPALAISLAEEDYLSTGDDAYRCIIILEKAGNLDLASWAGDAGAYFGFDFPADSGVQTNCNTADYPMDPATWGADPVTAIAAATWGLGVAPLDSDVKSSLKDAVDNEPSVDWDTDFAPYVVGAGFSLSLLAADAANFPGGFANMGFSRGFAVDENMKAIADESGNGTFLYAPGTDENPSTTIGKGAFVTSTWYVLQGAEMLASGAR